MDRRAARPARPPEHRRARRGCGGPRGVGAAEVGLLVAGFEVPHLHLHVFAASSMAAFDFANAAATIDPAEQDRHAAAAGGAAGRHRAFVPS